MTMKNCESLLLHETQGVIQCVWARVALCSSALNHDHLIQYAHCSNDKASIFFYFISQQGTSMKE